jgi:hypothetical protein
VPYEVAVVDSGCLGPTYWKMFVVSLEEVPEIAGPFLLLVLQSLGYLRETAALLTACGDGGVSHRSRPTCFETQHRRPFCIETFQEMMFEPDKRMADYEE